MKKHIMRLLAVMILTVCLTAGWFAKAPGRAEAATQTRVVIDKDMLRNAIKGTSGITKIVVSDEAFGGGGGTASWLSADSTDGRAMAMISGTTFTICPSKGGVTLALEGDCTELFSVTTYNQQGSTALDNLTTVDLRGLDTSGVTSFRGLFEAGWGYSSKLKSVNMKNLNFSSLTDTSRMFCNCSVLTTVTFSGTDWSHVMTTQEMFNNCALLAESPLKQVNFSSLTNAEGMFWACGITSFSFSGWNIGQLTTLKGFLRDCTALRSVEMTGINPASVTTYENMFQGCTNLVSVDISGFAPKSAASMESMFHGCSSLKTMDFSDVDLSGVNSFKNLFNGCTALTSVTFGNHATDLLKYTGGMFNGCINLKSIDLSHFTTPKLQEMDYMFQDCDSLTRVDLHNFTSGKLTTMQRMFLDCDNLQYVNLSGLTRNEKASKTIYAEAMFKFCPKLETVVLWKLEPDGIATGDGRDQFFGTFGEEPHTDNVCLTHICMNNDDLMKSFFNSIYGVDPSTLGVGGHTFNLGVCTACGMCVATMGGGSHPFGNGGICPVCHICRGVYENGHHNMVDGVCTYCGYTEVDTVMYGSVSLGANLSVNLYFVFPDTILTDSGAYLQLTLPGGVVKTLPISSLTTEQYNNKACKKAVYQIAAKEMADKVTVKVFNGSGESTFSKTVTVKKYAETIISGSKFTEEEKQLARAMLNYGANAQKYFSYKTSALANATYPDELPTDAAVLSGTADFGTHVDDHGAKGVVFEGCSLLLKDEITIRYWFSFDSSVNANKRSTYINNMQLTASGNKYYYESYALPVRNWGEYCLSAGDQFVVSYSPICFVRDSITFSGNEDLKNLVKSMYVYWQAAQAYVQAQQTQQ